MRKCIKGFHVRKIENYCLKPSMMTPSPLGSKPQNRTIKGNPQLRETGVKKQICVPFVVGAKLEVGVKKNQLGLVLEVFKEKSEKPLSHLFLSQQAFLLWSVKFFSQKTTQLRYFCASPPQHKSNKVLEPLHGEYDFKFPAALRRGPSVPQQGERESYQSNFS